MTDSNAKHGNILQLPWETKEEPSTAFPSSCSIVNAKGKRVTDQYKTHAELIVTAVNSHAVLVEALERYADPAYNGYNSDGKYAKKVLNKLKCN